VVTLQNYLAGFGGWVSVITGAIFVACVLLFRGGIVGELSRLSRFGSSEDRAVGEPVGEPSATRHP
jgi:branched-chain amino acid transport system permease protein